MIRYKLRELMASKQFREGRIVTALEISEKTGIHRTTLSRILNVRGTNTGTENIDLLCDFFKCPIQDVIEHVPEGNVPAKLKRKQIRR